MCISAKNTSTKEEDEEEKETPNVAVRTWRD